jgi:biopolymer transport protein ExbD
LRPDGIRLSGERVSMAVLSEKISARVAKNPEQKVIVKTAPGISYQQAIDLLDRIATSNVVDMSLIQSQGQ